MSIPRSRASALLALATLCGAGTSAHAAGVALARLDCGHEPAPVSVAAFSDTQAYPDMKLALAYSCYLVRDGDRYLLWDTGMAMDGTPHAPTASIVEQLARIGVKPEAIEYVGISHYHHDHTGQLAAFPKSTLLIGQGDWDAMRATAPAPGVDAKSFASQRAPFAAWTSGRGKAEPVNGDRDVFGDGRVRILDLPGHTPGNHGLLVKLDGMGNVLLTGDVTHFHENYRSDGVPTWNTNRADSLASLDRFKKLAANLKATVIIQHDPRDVEKLPVFPAFAR